ncbi:hypothetical protein, partial [Staphylococcus pseudintermedius]|uniref:hypothetical protein n=1 Tax=Staphylococcus pseudintermedius TaxID=283734 RepID=UPI000E383F82
TAYYADRTYPFLRRIGFDQVQAVVLDPEKQQALYDRNMIATAAVEQEPWHESVENERKQKIVEVEKV